MWWKDQTPKRKEDVKKLVKEKRLIFVNGGFSSPDEACTNFQGIIADFMLGHGFIKKEFGVDALPRVAW